MRMQNHGTTLPNGSFIEEYTTDFVDRWDELIDWERRNEAENGFFHRILKESGVQRVLDIACGTGFHTVTLKMAGFDVTGADGSANMLTKARENAKRYNQTDIRLIEAEWTALSQAFPNDKFDAIVCLGNAFTHLFDESDRQKALQEMHSLLNDDGIVIIDQRNYDSILDQGFTSKHQTYYLGETVNVCPEKINEEAVILRYEYADGSVHHLTFSPIRQDYLTELLKDAGFDSVDRYGDFEDEYDFYDPDFIIQVAKK
ncbi:MAG: class I SAM-dependent methyltransferase [Chloroflexi bacterium]|nr:class I SAM-dependent methyltransferase [Chloroflexota bacterium]MDA1271860.1 class I SAM-dependent methyltransferase [Chloroflexota bacterium]